MSVRWVLESCFHSFSHTMYLLVFHGCSRTSLLLQSLHIKLVTSILDWLMLLWVGLFGRVNIDWHPMLRKRLYFFL
ncbi:unnamed protein product [Musa acuminata var. zebrina]